MSRQGTPAAAGRRNLFQAERGAEAAPGPEDGIRTAGEEEEVADVPDAMELEHVIGFTGSFPSTALYHPRLGSKVIYACVGPLRGGLAWNGPLDRFAACAPHPAAWAPWS